MLKELLKSLYKSKPELVEEHRRLVDTLRSGSRPEQLKEAGRQLKELKEMVKKDGRCWDGYKPTPGKKPYEKDSCEPINKQDVLTFEKQDLPKSWKIKIKKEPGYHDVKDVLDMGSQQHNSYALNDGRIISHDQVEDLDISGKKPQDTKKTEEGFDQIKARHTAKTDSTGDHLTVLKEKMIPKIDKPLNQKIKEIKEKHADKPAPTDKERIAAIKEKYSSMLQKTPTDIDIQRIAREVAVRQPTDRELELLLDYQSKIAQNFNSVSIGDREEDTGY